MMYHAKQAAKAETRQVPTEKAAADLIDESVSADALIGRFGTMPDINGDLDPLMGSAVNRNAQGISFLLHLNRRLGNRQVGRMLRPIGNPHRAESKTSRSGFPLQPQLAIGAPNDPYEREADRAATQIMNQLQCPMGGGAGSTPKVHRPKLRSHAHRERSQLLPAQLANSIDRAHGGGRPLPDPVRETMENAFQADFSGVKIHVGAHANALNRAIQSRAFTSEQNIFFRDGEFDPDSRSGQELMAHELTHVEQQAQTDSLSAGPGMIQPAWLPWGNSIKWDTLVDGLGWYKSDNNQYNYFIEDESQIPEEISQTVDRLEGFLLTRSAWLEHGIQPPMDASDLPPLPPKERSLSPTPEPEVGSQDTASGVERWDPNSIEVYNQRRDRYMPAIREVIQDVLDEELTPGHGELLEIGSGLGDFARMTSGVHVQQTELEAEIVRAHLTKDPGSNVLQVDATRLHESLVEAAEAAGRETLKAKQFDALVGMNVLDVLGAEGRAQVLESAKQRLKPGAKLMHFMSINAHLPTIAQELKKQGMIPVAYLKPGDPGQSPDEFMLVPQSQFEEALVRVDKDYWRSSASRTHRRALERAEQQLEQLQEDPESIRYIPLPEIHMIYRYLGTHHPRMGLDQMFESMMSKTLEQVGGYQQLSMGYEESSQEIEPQPGEHGKHFIMDKGLEKVEELESDRLRAWITAKVHVMILKRLADSQP